MNKGVFRTELECILTEAEARTYSGELARQTQQQAELEDRKKEVTSDFKSRIDACVSQCRVIARKVSTGKEMRDVEVRWDFDFPANVKYLVRLDTYEIIDTKALNDNERQMCLDLEARENESEQTEGQNLLDEGFAQIQDEMVNGVEQPPVEDAPEVPHQEAGLCVLTSEETPCTGCDKCRRPEETDEGWADPPVEA